MYNEVFALPVPKGATIVCFGNDFAIALTAKHQEDVEVYTIVIVRAEMSCLETAELTLIDKKMEAVLIMNHRKKNTLKLDVGGQKII